MMTTAVSTTSTEPGARGGLPPAIASAIASAYQEYAAAERGSRHDAARRLGNVVTAGRNAGWSLPTLARACAVTPERLRQISKDWSDEHAAEIIFPRCQPLRRSAPGRGRREHLSEEQARELRDLAPLAAANTGSRAADAKERQSSERFSDLLIEHHDRGVTWRELSDATRPWTTWPLSDDVLEEIHQAREEGAPEPIPPTHQVVSLRMRAARHGYGSGPPPSMQRYQGVVAKSA